MELDKRIKSIDSIRCFNTNNDDCLGKFGYFTNFVTNFDDLNRIPKGICSFKDGSRFPFYCGDQKFQYFIPEISLKPGKPVKKYDEISILKYKVEKLEKNLIELQRKLNSQETMCNPFTPWTNCCNSVVYSDGFNPQANWCKSLEQKNER